MSGDIGELVGMVVALVAIAYTVVVTIRDLFGQKKREKTPAEKQAEKELLKQLFGRSEEEESEDEYVTATPPPLPQPTQKAHSSRGWPRSEEKFDFHSAIEGDSYRKKTAIEDRELQIKIRSGEELVSADLKVWGDGTAAKQERKEAPIVRMMKQLSDKKMLVVSAEIINPPLALRR